MASRASNGGWVVGFVTLAVFALIAAFAVLATLWRSPHPLALRPQMPAAGQPAPMVP
jgi:hypothetical protein